MLTSMRIARLTRRPPDSDIARQFLKGSLMNFGVAIVETVLSQFCTRTWCRSMSITVPSASACGTSTQSPIRTMSFEVIWMLAASETRVLRKTSMSAAAAAPTPERKTTGERPRRMATMTTPATE